MALNPIDDDLHAWLNLTLPAGIGPRAQQQLLSAFGTPTAVFDAGISAVASVIGIKLAQSLFDGCQQEAQQALIEKTHAWLTEPGHHLVTLADSAYPQRLLESTDPPSLLYVNGDPTYLNHPAIGVVGSRNATPQGIENARAFSKTLADAGFCVISGLALGIDAAAHEAHCDRTPAAAQSPSSARALTGSTRPATKSWRTSLLAMAASFPSFHWARSLPPVTSRGATVSSRVWGKPAWWSRRLPLLAP